MTRLLRRLFVAAAFLLPVTAHAALTVTPITWNIMGLDSNDPMTGPNTFPVGMHVCSDVATTNVSVNFVWDSMETLINLRTGSLSTVIIPSIGAGGCADAYFEVEITRNATAFDKTRRYHVTATDGTGTYSSPTPREIYVERLISQNRNSISDVKFGTTVMNLQSVPPGGNMAMVVGETYVVQVTGGTATQGYEQFEEFINFSNAIFRILAVETDYSADSSPYVDDPADKLYADACLWENDPNSPNYRSCVGGTFKAGGSTVVTTYTIEIVGGGGTNQTLTTLLYDFSGSSFHYNADYSTGARIGVIIDPSNAGIAKSFSPNPAPLNGTSVLTITLTNPNGATVGGYNFVDNLPANLVVAATPNATTSGCGTPTLTATAGSGSITFSSGTLAANSNCVITVNVTPSATGTLVNTTGNLFVGTTDTGNNATANLTVDTAPPPGTGLCNVTFAAWTFPSGFTLASPAPSSGIVSGTATATPGGGLSNPTVSSTNSTTTADGTLSWGTNGSVTTGATLVTANDEYYEFGVDTTGVTSITLTFDARFRGGQGPTGIAVFYSTAAKTPGATEASSPIFNNNAVLTTQNNWQTIAPPAVITGLNSSGKTYFRIYTYNSNQTNGGQDSNIDNVRFTGCTAPIQPTIAKSFSPDPIAVNGVSTLTFTLTNTNTAALTGAAFTDDLFPAGLQVAATPAAATTCGGTWAPAAAATMLTFSGGTIPASGSCTVSVNVTATSAGPHSNVSSPISTTESGTNTNSLATDTLTALLPPVIAKQFDPAPIIPNGITTLTFSITNPNQNDALASVAFTDALPAAPGQMVVAPLPNATVTNCGSPTFAPTPGATSLTFSGGTIAGGAICVVTVDVTAPVVGTYNNTTGNVSTVINGNTVNGNTASDSLDVVPPEPSLSLLKQVSLSASGPWTSFVPVTGAQPVFYRFTVENTGDVPLSPISINDDTLDVSSCNSSFASLTLPPPDPNNENHIVSCIVGPVATTAGSHTNTASATGTFGGNDFESDESSATYATTGLTLDKTAVQSTFTNAGDTINYNYLVTNSGFAPLIGPVTVADDKATVTCPAVTTVGDLDNFLEQGESITCTASYIVTAGDVTAAFVTNTATATVDGVNSNQDSATVVLSTSADVSMVKTLVTVGPYTVGQTINYTLFVANAGPSTATNVQVTDTPANLTITTVSGGCVALPCVIASIPAGGDVTINVSATIDAAGAFDNVATATATEPDPNPSNNTDNTGNNGITGASADVSITKTLDTAPPYTVAQTITYTLVVSNAGPSTATNIQVTDTPSNLTIQTVSGSGCVALPCTIASLASGASTNITVTATIDEPGDFDNAATVDADEPDPDPSDNTDDTGNGGTAEDSADVAVDKTLDTAGPYSVGQTITYTITVSNNGPSTATNIQVTDTPSNLTIQTVSSTNCSSFPCTIPLLTSGGSEVITVTATIDSPGLFNNVVTVTATEPDPNVSNNTDNTGNSGDAGAEADVSITKTLDTAGPYFVGQTVTYTLLVANAGPQPATNINVTDTPTNLSIVTVSGACTSLPCIIANLASGADTTITVTATIVAEGAFDNAATANGAETDPNPSDNEDETGNGGTANPSADVSITKTLVTAGPYSVGQSITYTLFIENFGPSTATSINVTDTPTNLTITGVSGACASLPCTIPSLAVGADATITVTATIAVGAEVSGFNNAATANATESDPNQSNNEDNQGNGGEATLQADVSLTKTLDTAGPYSVGQTITYTLVVANAGPSTATSVQVTDTPANLTIQTVSGGGCAALPCTIPSIASGASVNITVTATIAADGAFDNSATATATETDPNPSNNTDNTGNNGVTGVSADVSLSKTLDTAGPYTVGQTITYTLVVANAGPSTATNVQVTDTPANLTIQTVSGGGCAALPCTIPSITSGASVNITVTATIVADGAFDNSATATATETDPNPSNNTDNTGNNESTTPSADVSITKTLDTAGPYSAGQSITYTLVVANAGPSTATTVQVTDTPANLTITNVSGGGCAALPCVIASIASGASVNITVTATIDAVGAFDNSATAMAAETDPNLSNNTDNTGNNGITGASADVSVVKTLVTAGPYSAGQTITYTLEIANAGPSPATNLLVTDTPTNLTITNVSGGGCAALPCTIPNLAVGASVTITITATINGVGAFDNEADVAANEPDPNMANNLDDTGNDGVVATGADLEIVKTATTGTFTVGQTFDYILTVENNGPDTATNVVVTDTLPANFSLISATSTQGTCSGTTTVTCTVGTMLAGATVTITIRGTVTTASPTMSNTATVDATEDDPVPANNTDVLVIGATAAGIPTASEWGLLMMALLLAIAGALVMRR